MERINYSANGVSQPHYMLLIKQHPSLTRSENQELLRAAQTGDRRAIEKVIEGNYRLAAAIIEKYFHYYLQHPANHLSPDDLFSAAVIGLERSIKGFHSSKGAFSTYASYWILQSVQRTIQDVTNEIRYPVHVLERMRKKCKNGACDDFRQGIDDGGFGRVSHSYDDHQATGSDESVQGEWRDNHHRCEPEETDADLSTCLEVAIAKLEPHEVLIIRKYYGLGGQREQPLREIGLEMGLSYECIRTKRDKALAKLKRYAPELGQFIGIEDGD